MKLCNIIASNFLNTSGVAFASLAGNGAAGAAISKPGAAVDVARAARR
jgi:hypothetical protein